MSSYDITTCDVLVVGAGLAGERAAVSASEAGHNVLILSLIPPRRSHSAAAQGGMQAALGNSAMGKGDSPDVHMYDTVKGSDWGCEQDVARMFVDTAPIAVREMAHWGVPWSRVRNEKRMYEGTEIVEDPEKAGLITARNFGGTAKWRTCYTSDGAGHTLLYAMDSIVVKLGITVHDRMEAVELIHDGERCYGVVARSLRDGKLHVYVAKTTVIATGGFGRLYAASTNAVINDGGGVAMALNSGVVPLGNMEAIQFHPTGMVPSWILITEGARGEGGHLLDKDGYRFMPDYEPKYKELASRDVVSRRIMQHIHAGHGVDSPYGPHVWLDIRHLGEHRINTYLREISTIARTFAGIDPVKELIPVRPTQHYTMGGIRTNKDGKVYGLEGLFALGESACWDLHGFNRLGGNSLAETIVAGRIVGAKIAEYTKQSTIEIKTALIEEHVSKVVGRIDTILARGNNGENLNELRKEMQMTLELDVGIFRTAERLQNAVDKLRALYERSHNIALMGGGGSGADPELVSALRMPGMIKLALTIAEGALARQESRGSHYREDFPKRDDANWLKRTLAYWPEGAKSPVLKYESITITEIPPGDRGYGESSGKK